MRSKLAKLGRKNKYRFIGTFSRVGGRKVDSGYVKTVCLYDVRLDGTGEVLTAHIWIEFVDGFKGLGYFVRNKTRFAFDARVSKYSKGYINVHLHGSIEGEYRLADISNVEMIEPLSDKAASEAYRRYKAKSRVASYSSW